MLPHSSDMYFSKSDLPRKMLQQNCLGPNLKRKHVLFQSKGLWVMGPWSWYQDPRTKNQGARTKYQHPQLQKTWIKDGIWPVGHVSAVLCWGTADAVPQHSTAQPWMTSWPNSMQCLGSDDIMCIGIKYFTTKNQGSTTKNKQTIKMKYDMFKGLAP